MTVMLLATLILGTAVLAPIPTPLAVPPVTLTSAWTTIPLPEMPLGIAEHDGKLWVCGANEMIAMSADGGSHWTLLHEKDQGEMLFSLAFPGPNEVQAYGTGGRRVVSTDGGVTWNDGTFEPGGALTHVLIAGNVAFGGNATGFGWSKDGGASWRMRAPALPGSKKDETPTIHGFALRDGTHAVMLVSDKVVATSDAGKTWHMAGFAPEWRWDAVHVEGGGYRIYGSYEAKGQPFEPAVAFSVDGASWSVERDPAMPAGNCNAEGCLIEDGWADMRNSTPQYLALPADADEPLTNQWAAVGDTFCRVSADVRCRVGREAWFRPRTPAVQDVSEEVQNAKCISCAQPKYPEADRTRYIQGVVLLHAWIGTDGLIHQVIVLDAASPGLAASSLQAVKAWRYHPLMLDGKPQTVDTTITVRYILGG